MIKLNIIQINVWERYNETIKTYTWESCLNMSNMFKTHLGILTFVLEVFDLNNKQINS